MNAALPDLLQEYADAMRLAERVSLAAGLVRHGITEADQRATDWIGAAHILTGGGEFNPYFGPIPDPAERKEWLYAITPIRDPDGELANLVAWRPDRAETFLRMPWPAVLGLGIPGEEDDPIARALSCSEPIVVYGSVSGWHRQTMGPGVVLLGDVGDLWSIRRAVTDDPITAARLEGAGITARLARYRHAA